MKHIIQVAKLHSALCSSCTISVGFNLNSVMSEQTIKTSYVPLSPEELFRGGECCTTFVPPESTCNLLCWSKSKTSSPGTSSIGSCSDCIHTKIELISCTRPHVVQAYM